MSNLQNFGTLPCRDSMKLAAILVGLLLAAFFVFAYLHSKSIDRAHLNNAKSLLLAAQRELEDAGTLSDTSRSNSVEIATNEFVVNGTNFKAQFAVSLPALIPYGHLILTTNGAFIWNDKRDGLMIIGGDGFRHQVPPSFRDF